MFVNSFINPILLPALMFVFMDNFNTIVETFVRLDIRKDKTQMMKNPELSGSEFDFIIVGCGSAGSHIANRLSEKHRVLVLEAGGSPDPLLNMPGYSYLLNELHSLDFGHITVPQKKAGMGLKNQVLHWPAGKQLGGSSTLSTLTYHRGNVQGFDEMASELGDGKWSTQHLLEYYEKIENYQHGWHSGNHKTGGSMNIEGSPVTKVVEKLREAAEEIGLPIRDPNQGPNHTEGFSYADNHMRFGRRNNAYMENLQHLPTQRKENLIIRKFSLVTKISFNGSNCTTLRATGVKYERHGRTFDVVARKEVILSAGALGTAKLLMLSGIGPEKDLQNIGIQCLVDLPVGQSLQDMYGVILGPFLVDKGYSFVRERDITMGSIAQWTLSGKGPLASTKIEATYDLISNYSRNKAKERESNDAGKPDIHIVVVAASADDQTSTAATEFGRSFNSNQKSIHYFTKTIGEDSFYQIISLSSPKQTGYVKLRDANPWTSLEINPRYFENDDDMEVLKEGMRFAVKLVEETDTMKNIRGRLFRIPYPGCESHELTFDSVSDDYLECFARHATFTLFRYCGTAPIGSLSSSSQSKKTVVDGDFRVKDIENLRVVDASVLQLKHVTVSDSTVRALGEFAASVILKYYDTT